MERYENIVKIEEIRRLADDRQYLKAVKILDTMDISKIKALTDLSIIADVFMQNERYDDAMIVLTKIYGKTKTRRVLYQLVDLSIKRGSISEAEDYLERYIKAAPQDSSRFIFRYCIDKLNGEPYEILIASLEQLKEYEYFEMWAYELAKLYHKAGMKDKCVRECSDIVLWFGEGIYVEKAKLLKAYYVGEINPIHMLKAKEKKEAEKKLGLDKTKDFSAMRSQIDQLLATEEYTEQKINQIFGQETEQKSKKEIPQEIGQESEQENEQEIGQESEQETGQESELENEQEMGQELEQENEQEMGQELDQKTEQENEFNQRSEEKINQFEPTEDLDEETQYNDDFSEKHYLSGKFDSIFSEAGMDYEKDFGYFIYIDPCRKQIETCLENILSDYTKINHLIITGERKSGKTILAKKISKALYGLNWINTNRVAKISAVKLNGISLESKKDKLINSSLIIEEAGLLDNSAVEQLLSLMQDLNGNIFVILEDDDIRMNQLLKTNPKLIEFFHGSIQLPKYTKQDLLGFANTYIENNDYEFTRDVKTAFENEIEKIINSVKDENQLEAVMDLARKVKSSADERNKKMLSEIVHTRDLGSEDFLFIKKEDFLWED